MELLIAGIVLCVCLVLSCAGFVWMKMRESATVQLMSDTFDNIEGKTAADAMPIVRRAYPGKPVKVFKDGENEPKEDAVHLVVDASGKIIRFSKPGGDGIAK